MQDEYENLKMLYGEALTDEELWELAVDGEDTRGRLFGFGNRSRTSKVNKALAAEDATMSDPARSTATSAEDERGTFTKAQVRNLVAAQRKKFASEIAAQEKRYREELEEFKKQEEYNKKCIAAIVQATGVSIPPPDVNSLTL